MLPVVVFWPLVSVALDVVWVILASLLIVVVISPDVVWLLSLEVLVVVGPRRLLVTPPLWTLVIPVVRVPVLPLGVLLPSMVTKWLPPVTMHCCVWFLWSIGLDFY